MKEFYRKSQEYISDHKKEFTTGTVVIVVIAAIFLILALISYNSRPTKIVYEPANACSLLTLDEAKSLLGDKTIKTAATNPTQTKDLTVSSCGYSDGLPDTSQAIVAAIVVRSGINDAGIAQNKTQFEAGKPSAGIENVKGIGDDAYYNTGLGQLNILKDSTWIIVSYGPGAAPQGNSLQETEKLAKLVLNAQ